LLLTTSQYPTPFEDVNLNKLKTLMNEFPTIPMGFSDHTQGILASSLAVSLGACVFEKHFTLDNHLPGPDHWFSENPENLKKWVKSIKDSYVIMGSNLVKPTSKEEEMKILARRSLAIVKNISMGEILTSTNIGFRRPGNGLPASFFENVSGKKAKKNLSKGTLLTKGDFS
jgi:sialic acid synthase SpsE